MRKWATCQLSACPHRETNTAVQAAPRGASVLGPAPSPVTWPGSHQTWCSLHVAEGSTGPSGGLARQVLRVHKAVLVSAGQGQWLGLRPSWATWTGGAVAEALCVDVEGCAPAELPWATLLGVICESGRSHPPGASSWGTRKVSFSRDACREPVALLQCRGGVRGSGAGGSGAARVVVVEG